MFSFPKLEADYLTEKRMCIFVCWTEQIKMLTGHTARPDFLRKLTWVALCHHNKITHIDTVRAFHFGNKYLVEVDIVLPQTMSLLEAHDIGETLQVNNCQLELELKLNPLT